MNNKLAEPGLFTTDDTRAGISPETLKSIERHADPHGHTAIVGPSDFQEDGFMTGQGQGLFERAGIQPGSEASFFLEDVFGAVAGTGVSIGGPRMNQYFEPELPTPEGEANPNALPDNTCLITFPMEGGEVIMGEDLKSYDFYTTQDYAGALLSIDPALLEGEDLPGTPQDLQYFTAHHELEHCHNMDDKFYEYYADAEANARFAQGLSEGAINTAEFPYFMRSIRAGAAMTSKSGDAYLTNGITPLAGEAPLKEHELEAAEAQISEVRDRVYSEIEEATGMTQEELMSPEHDALNSQLVYSQSKLMLEQGAFDDVPYGKQTAQNFIDGAQRYMPDLYEVQPNDLQMAPPQMPLEAYGISPNLFNGPPAQVLQHNGLQ